MQIPHILGIHVRETFVNQLGTMAHYGRKRVADFSDERVLLPPWWTWQSKRKLYAALKQLFNHYRHDVLDLVETRTAPPCDGRRAANFADERVP